MQSEDGIFKFSDPIDYLNYAFESKRMKNNSFSLRAWSRQLGYENPSFVSHILKKQRSLRIDTASKFITNLKLTGSSKKYFELLVLMKNSKTSDEKKIYTDLLESLRSKNASSPQSLNIEVFRIISDWYHTAILEIVELSDFDSDVTWIKGRLGNEISTQNIIKAIGRLLMLGLLKRSPSGKLTRAMSNALLLENHIPSEAIRYFHKQMLDKAKAAIESQSVEDRDIRGTMISVRKNDYTRIQEIIKKAHAEVAKFSCDGNGDELYQFNTQFFRITKRNEEI